MDELFQYGYLRTAAGNDVLFTDAADATCIAEPNDAASPWEGVGGLYGKSLSACEGDLSYIKKRIEGLALTSQMESILWYWQAHFEALSSARTSEIKYPLRYDFTILILWFLWDHFLFEAGDELQIQKDGKPLRFSDDAAKKSILALRSKQRTDKMVVSEATVVLWNKLFSSRKIQVPADMIGSILRSRAKHKECHPQVGP